MTEYREGMLTMDLDGEVTLVEGRNIECRDGVYTKAGLNIITRKFSIEALMSCQNLEIQPDCAPCLLENISPGMALPVQFRKKNMAYRLAVNGGDYYLAHVTFGDGPDWTFGLTREKSRARVFRSIEKAEGIMAHPPVNGMKAVLSIESEEVPEDSNED